MPSMTILRARTIKHQNPQRDYQPEGTKGEHGRENAGGSPTPLKPTGAGLTSKEVTQCGETPRICGQQCLHFLRILKHGDVLDFLHLVLAEARLGSDSSGAGKGVCLGGFGWRIVEVHVVHDAINETMPRL
jgi:hypothetical protein